MNNTKEKTAMKNIKHTVQISSNGMAKCEHCTFMRGHKEYEIVREINHYISEHGYQLLHVGQESHDAQDGRSLDHSTVAILGKP